MAAPATRLVHQRTRRLRPNTSARPATRPDDEPRQPASTPRQNRIAAAHGTLGCWSAAACRAARPAAPARAQTARRLRSPSRCEAARGRRSRPVSARASAARCSTPRAAAATHLVHAAESQALAPGTSHAARVAAAGSCHRPGPAARARAAAARQRQRARRSKSCAAAAARRAGAASAQPDACLFGCRRKNQAALSPHASAAGAAAAARRIAAASTHAAPSAPLRPQRRCRTAAVSGAEGRQ
jgi:hypothetical protein